MGRTGRWQDISTAGKIRCQVKTKKTYEKLAKSGKEATFTCVLVVHVYLLCWKTYAWHLGALLRSQFHSVQVSLLGMAWFFQLLGKRKRKLFSCISFSSTGGVFAAFGFQPSWTFWHFTPPGPRQPAYVCEWFLW